MAIKLAACHLVTTMIGVATDLLNLARSPHSVVIVCLEIDCSHRGSDDILCMVRSLAKVNPCPGVVTVGLVGRFGSLFVSDFQVIAMLADFKILLE